MAENTPAPMACDLCGTSIKNTYADAVIPRLMVWATLCPRCADLERVRYGTGRGQLFQRESPDAAWTKSLG